MDKHESFRKGGAMMGFERMGFELTFVFFFFSFVFASFFHLLFQPRLL